MWFINFPLLISTAMGGWKFLPTLYREKMVKTVKSLTRDIFLWKLVSVYSIYLSSGSDWMKWHIALLFDSVNQGVIDVPLAPAPLSIIQLCLMNVMGYLWRLGNESPDRNRYVEQAVNQPVRFWVLFKVEHET